MNRYICFDVETPNSKNDRICAIGIAVLENGEVTQAKSYLVNPECDFSYWNIKTHGIQPEDVAEAPTFPAVWSEIRDLFFGNIIAAHNARFDMSVLSKTLIGYGLFGPVVRYICTCIAARHAIPEVEQHGLGYLCTALNIPLEHHNAGSDSVACARLLRIVLDKEHELEYFEYDLSAAGVSPRQSPRRQSQEHRQVNAIDVALKQGASVDGKLVCLSGEFACGTREEVAALLVSGGAVMRTNISKKTDMLLIGSYGSELWKRKSGGAKIQRADELGVLTLDEFEVFERMAITRGTVVIT